MCWDSNFFCRPLFHNSDAGMESTCPKPSSGSHWQVTQALGASDVTGSNDSVP